jgi:hypothetical protein
MSIGTGETSSRIVAERSEPFGAKAAGGPSATIDRDED